MLRITIPAVEYFKEETMEFIEVEKECTLQLEHSLVSVSKWESKWHKPFLHSGDTMSVEENLDYIRCMTITQNVDPDVYNRLTEQHIKQIMEYVNAPMTATTFIDDKTGKRNREIVTAEIIYYWMIANNIPIEFQKWHLNKLITLIRVCNEKNAPPKKMSKKDILSRNAALNAARRKQFNSKG